MRLRSKKWEWVMYGWVIPLRVFVTTTGAPAVLKIHFYPFPSNKNKLLYKDLRASIKKIHAFLFDDCPELIKPARIS